MTVEYDHDYYEDVEPDLVDITSDWYGYRLAEGFHELTRMEIEPKRTKESQNTMDSWYASERARAWMDERH